MLKRFTAILLLTALISSNYALFMVYAGFELNHKYIADNLCINKNKPWLHCNGKCYFMRKINQAGENQKKQEARDNVSRIEIPVFNEPYRLAFEEPVILETLHGIFTSYTYQYSSPYIDAIFRPPKQVA